VARATGTTVWQLCSAGSLSTPPSFNVAANVDPVEVERALGGTLDERGELMFPCNVLVIRAGGRLALVDTGAGPYFGGAGAALVEALASASASAEDVDLVVLTHGHPDHVGGAMTALGPTCVHARHAMSRSEYNHWSQRPEPPPFFVEQVIPLAERGLLDLFEDGAELLPGVRLCAAPGHTPGQCAVEVEEDGRHLLFLADAVMSPVHFPHPDWVGTVENDPVAVEETRHRLFTRAVDDQLLVGASHLWHPGRVSREGDAFRFIAELSP
jgi:glyoxylase-like metal-dependent hydrolase (beta-lactamase superfamily II)